MKICVLGAGGFIGTNLINKLSALQNVEIFACDYDLKSMANINSQNNVCFKTFDFFSTSDLSDLLKGIDIVVHLISSNIPGTKGIDVKDSIIKNVFPTLNLLDNCVAFGVKKVVFLSSGGAIYGINSNPKCSENTKENPISPYGLQKLFIEKTLMLYNYHFKLNYNIVRLSNPYGPYQNPFKGQGVISTYVFNALNGIELNLYGDGNIVRDYIFIDDAIYYLVKIILSEKNGVYNVGSGIGNKVSDIINLIKANVNSQIKVNKLEGRLNDIPVNILDITKLINDFGKIQFTNLNDGIQLTKKFFMKGVLNENKK